MQVRFTQMVGGKPKRVYFQRADSDKATERLYRYAVKVATADFLIELVSGDEVKKSHRVEYDPKEREPMYA